ncbi:MAG TPA: FecR domain-containing protein [Flavisolibacter sp.]|nr:FecR domain-containing protein [Flavisolibacter sp.]
MSWIDHIAPLITGYNNGTLSQTEQNELSEWINTSKANKLLFDELTDPDRLRGHLRQMEAFDEATAWQRIKESGLPMQAPIVPMYRRRWYAWTSVAAIVLLMVTGYFILGERKTDNILPPVAATKDVEAPKETKAVITLADGRQVELDSINSGILAVEGNVNVVRNAEGEIVYSGNAIDVAFNTLYNPRGSKVISLILHDGTRVWLNNESSITYPTAFTAGERRVEITGEVYMEVAKNASKPFKVVINNGSEVEVIGTRFNINSYKDEAVAKTTLLEGKIRFTKNGSSRILLPGQQVQVNKEGDITLVNDANTEEAMAWKNGYFHFVRADLPTVMKQLARWYDLDVQFEGPIAPREFGGEMQRSLPLSSALKLFEKGKIRFRVESKKLTVLP